MLDSAVPLPPWDVADIQALSTIYSFTADWQYNYTQSIVEKWQVSHRVENTPRWLLQVKNTTCSQLLGDETRGFKINPSVLTPTADLCR